MPFHPFIGLPVLLGREVQAFTCVLYLFPTEVATGSRFEALQFLSVCNEEAQSVPMDALTCPLALYRGTNPFVCFRLCTVLLPPGIARVNNHEASVFKVWDICRR